MTSPTHTHIIEGGRFGQVAIYWGSGPLDGQQLVAYQDLDRDTQSVTTLEDWQQRWRPVNRDDCSVCLGAGHDQIKGNKDKPCGGCYGLGKVLPDGQQPTDLWELASVATCIIQHQRSELEQQRQALELPEVQAALAAHHAQKQQRIDDEVTRQEQEWRNGKGRGHGGRRYTGD